MDQSAVHSIPLPLEYDSRLTMSRAYSYIWMTLNVHNVQVNEALRLIILLKDTSTLALTNSRSSVPESCTIPLDHVRDLSLLSMHPVNMYYIAYDYGIFSLRLIWSAMFGVTFNPTLVGLPLSMLCKNGDPFSSKSSNFCTVQTIRFCSNFNSVQFKYFSK